MPRRAADRWWRLLAGRRKKNVPEASPRRRPPPQWWMSSPARRGRRGDVGRERRRTRTGVWCSEPGALRGRRPSTPRAPSFGLGGTGPGRAASPCRTPPAKAQARARLESLGRESVLIDTATTHPGLAQRLAQRSWVVAVAFPASPPPYGRADAAAAPPTLVAGPHWVSPLPGARGRQQRSCPPRTRRHGWTIHDRATVGGGWAT